MTCTVRGQRRLGPDEVSRYLFRRVVSWGRSSNVFLENGSRLYLDVGSHPEYATAECDDVRELVAQDKAGERILEDLGEAAEQRLHDEGVKATVHLLKNNTDCAGNSYGCHENYLARRDVEPERYHQVLVPFLASRQIWAGAGHVLQTAKGPVYSISQRAEHVWEAASSATTRSRPIINTRDEPHADPEEYRRLHVIAGDSNMNEVATFMKVAATACVLTMAESRSFLMRDVTLEHPIRAVRDISLDTGLRRTVRLASGREVTALDIQREYLLHAERYDDAHGFGPVERLALAMWRQTIEALESDPSSLARRVDWITKKTIIDGFMERHGCAFDDPRVAMIDLQYHDIRPSRGLYYRAQAAGGAERMVGDDEIQRAVEEAPASTRAALRGRFIRRAKERRRDYTVDWVHLKVNDQAQRTVMCKDPFRSSDERVERLIASL